MSRIGRLPVAIPAGVEVTVADGNVVTVKGPKGTLERALPTELEIKVEDGHVVVTRPNDLKRIKALHGLTRSLIHNMVVGVSEGYKKAVSYTHLDVYKRQPSRDMASPEDLWLTVLNIIVMQVPTALAPIRARFSKENICQVTWDMFR